MRIIIKATNLKLSRGFRDWISRKFDPIKKLHPHFRKRDKLPGGGGDERTDIRVEIERIKKGQKKGRIFRAEVQFSLPGRVLIRAEAVADNIRTAVEKARDRLARRIKRYKGKKKPWAQ
jgi:ribosomal subunit interface protein